MLLNNKSAKEKSDGNQMIFCSEGKQKCVVTKCMICSQAVLKGQSIALGAHIRSKLSLQEATGKNEKPNFTEENNKENKSTIQKREK